MDETCNKCGRPADAPCQCDSPLVQGHDWEQHRDQDGTYFVCTRCGNQQEDRHMAGPCPYRETPKASTNPKDKIGRTKPPMHLIPSGAMIEEAMVMGLGADKYGPYNWRGKSVSATVYVAALLRHVYSWLDGEDNDTESGHSHLAHARACLGILLDAKATEALIDDRPSPGRAADLIVEYTKETK